MEVLLIDATGASQISSAHTRALIPHDDRSVGSVVDVTDAHAEPATPEPAVTGPAPSGVDLGRVSADLDGVEAALARLDDGTYWTDEVTGEPIPDDMLVADPVARRA
jgi:hypothetical protein